MFLILVPYFVRSNEVTPKHTQAKLCRDFPCEVGGSVSELVNLHFFSCMRFLQLITIFITSWEPSRFLSDNQNFTKVSPVLTQYTRKKSPGWGVSGYSCPCSHCTFTRRVFLKNVVPHWKVPSAPHGAVTQGLTGIWLRGKSDKVNSESFLCFIQELPNHLIMRLKTDHNPSLHFICINNVWLNYIIIVAC